MRKNFGEGIVEPRIVALIDEICSVTDFPHVGEGDGDVSRTVIYFVFISPSIPDKL